MTREKADAFTFAHHANIERYRSILRTCLTDQERAFVKRRLAEEEIALQELVASAPPTDTSRDVV